VEPSVRESSPDAEQQQQSTDPPSSTAGAAAAEEGEAGAAAAAAVGGVEAAAAAAAANREPEVAEAQSAEAPKAAATPAADATTTTTAQDDPAPGEAESKTAAQPEVKETQGNGRRLPKAHSTSAVSRRVASSPSRPSNVLRPRRVIPKRPWDNRFQLLAVENELLPKQLRSYFSRPASLPELKQELSKRNSPASMIKRLDAEEEAPWTQPTIISADASPPPCPGRHMPGGSMSDRLGTVRPWNNRWQVGVHTTNEYLHPVQRSAFARRSPLEYATSQKWRRIHEVEAERGVWTSVEDSCPPRFPPMGA